MRFYTLFFLAICFGCSSEIFAQSPLKIKGKVLEDASGNPLEFATVKLTDPGSAALLGGTTSDVDGIFELSSEQRNLLIEVSFLGFEIWQDSVAGHQGAVLDLGEIRLKPDAQALSEVVVRGERSQTEYKLDKRIFQVGNDLANTGASALDVLNQVPSVYVTVKGEISLRGNSGVQILINGKPSILANGGNTLGTLTAEMIERIEVITNPSAKYDAEGTAGIINIVLKNDQRQGVNGAVTLNTGVPNNHSLGFSINRRTEDLNLFAQLGIGHRTFWEEGQTKNQDLTTLNSVASDGEGKMHETYYMLNLGADYRLGESSVLSLAARYALEKEKGSADGLFTQTWGETTEVQQWERTEDTHATNPKYQFEAQYKVDFEKEENPSRETKHELIVVGLGDFFAKDQTSEFLNTPVAGEMDLSAQSTLSDHVQSEYTLKADYTLPWAEKGALEAGSQYVISQVSNKYAVFDRYENDWEIDPDLSNDFEFNQNVLAVYATGSYEWEKFGVKLGLRTEATDMETLLKTTGEGSSRNYLDWFPTLHSSYKLSDGLSLQGGYSRRIQRPSLWDLNPFFSMRNNYSISTGNPDLQPEYTDSYELTSISEFGAFSVNVAAYYRYTQGAVQQITTFEDQVSYSMPMNLGTDRSKGIEFNVKFTPVQWLVVNGEANVSHYQREGEYESQSFDFDATMWTSRLSTRIDLPADFALELIGHYASEQETLQGYISENKSADLGLRKKLLKGRLITNLSVRDVFASRVFENHVIQPEFTDYSRYKPGRYVTFGVSFGFGKGEAMEFASQKMF